MQSLLALVLVACVLAVPGVAASLAAFKPGEVSILTRSAAAFGLGFAAAGGCAFALAAAHAFRLSVFIPLWVVVSAVLWILAVRRAPLREQARALADDIRTNRFPLLLGFVVIAALLIVSFRFLYLLGGPRYVYYLNGLEIANSGGVPSSTLEYGQGWPPATDKIFLDAFTGVAALISHNVAVGPGVLLWISILGSALGLWAAAWELGLRRTGALLPLLLLANEVFLNTSVTTDFSEYRGEDFGRAVAFCALALGVFAIRERRWGPAAIAGVVLAAATGSHLIPVVVVVIALTCYGLAELIRDRGIRARLVTLRTGMVVAGATAALGVVIRVFAGGSFGLAGASNQSGYSAIHTSFDPTAYLYYGGLLPRDLGGRGHWYMPPSQVIDTIMAGNGIGWPAWALWLLLAGCLLAMVLLFIYGGDDLMTVGVVGTGIGAGVIVAGLAFAYHYHVYIDATAGVRRLRESLSLGLILLALGVIEGLLLLLARSRPRLALGTVLVIVVGLAAWLLPTDQPLPNGQPPALTQLSNARIRLVNWIRTGTPCDARFLVNQRTEGAIGSLTGRFALLEGMGPFLRTDKLPYVINLMLSARRFFQAPLANEAFLREHDISYVVVARANLLLGYAGPAGRANYAQLQSAPFLRPVLVRPSEIVYQVAGAHPTPISPFLKGPELHCLTQRVHF